LAQATWGEGKCSCHAHNRIMGGEGGLKHVVHKRVHLERHQPAARKRFGYLEKHKDYVKRARDYHRKEQTIKKMHQKAFFKNEDEFAWGMMNHQMVDGRNRKKAKHLSNDELRLAESQDARYVGYREQQDKKAIEKQAANLHFLDAERPNKHTLFIDDDDLPAASAKPSAGAKPAKGAPTAAAASQGGDKLQDFDIAGHLDTHPALLKRKANRLRRRQLDTASLSAPAGATAAAAQGAYRELLHRSARAKKLGRVREELELRQHLRTKGKKMKVQEASGGKPAQYRWFPERKR